MQGEFLWWKTSSLLAVFLCWIHRFPLCLQTHLIHTRKYNLCHRDQTEKTFQGTNVRNYTWDSAAPFHDKPTWIIFHSQTLRLQSQFGFLGQSCDELTNSEELSLAKGREGGGWSFLDPFLVSGDIEASKTLEDSLGVSVVVSRGWIVPRDALAMLRPICHSNTFTQTN